MATTITDETILPEFNLSFSQLLNWIRNLDAGSRTRIAQVLMETEMDSRLEALVRSLVEKHPVPLLSDTEIQAEIQAVRRGA